MAAIKPEYMLFYILGREADTLDDKDVDVDEVTDRVMAGSDLREQTIAVGTTLAARSALTERKSWTKENREEITEAGGDAEEAFRCYQQGRIEQYAHELEAAIVEGMLEGDDEEEEDEEDEEETDDEEEEG